MGAGEFDEAVLTTAVERKPVLALAIHPPLQQFGTVTAIMIAYAFLGAVVVLPSLLVLWARFQPGASDAPTGDAAPAPQHDST